MLNLGSSGWSVLLIEKSGHTCSFLDHSANHDSERRASVFPRVCFTTDGASKAIVTFAAITVPTLAVRVLKGWTRHRFRAGWSLLIYLCRWIYPTATRLITQGRATEMTILMWMGSRRFKRGGRTTSVCPIEDYKMWQQRSSAKFFLNSALLLVCS